MLNRFFKRMLEFGVLASTLALLGSVLIQVYARFFLPSAPSWTEEASRLFFVYAIAFASGLAFKDQYYVHLDLFYDRMPKSAKRLVSRIIPAMIGVLFAVMAFYSVKFVILGHAEFSPSLKFRMSIAFTSMFVMASSIVLYAGKELFDQFKSKEV